MKNIETSPVHNNTELNLLFASPEASPNRRLPAVGARYGGREAAAGPVLPTQDSSR